MPLFDDDFHRPVVAHDPPKYQVLFINMLGVQHTQIVQLDYFGC